MSEHRRIPTRVLYPVDQRAAEQIRELVVVARYAGRRPYRRTIAETIMDFRVTMRRIGRRVVIPR